MGSTASLLVKPDTPTGMFAANIPRDATKKVVPVPPAKVLGYEDVHGHANETSPMDMSFASSFDVHGSCAGDVLEEVLTYTAARFYECTDESQTMGVEELQGFIAVIFTCCGKFNGKRLSPSAVVNLVASLTLRIRDSQVQYVGWRDVSLIVAAMLDMIFMFEQVEEQVNAGANEAV